MEPFTIDIMGQSAAGKGTLIKRLNKFLAEKTGQRVVYAQTGDLIREFKEGPSLGARRSKEIYSKCERQPDYLAIYLWAKHINENLESEDMHLVLDGLPRSYPEAQMVKTMIIGHFQRKNPTIIHLKVSDETATKRMLKRGRPDDTPEGIKTRLAWFWRDVIPAIDLFRNDPDFRFIEIDAEQTEEKVFLDVLSELFPVVLK